MHVLWSLEDERHLREIRPWMKPARNWQDLDPLGQPEPFLDGFSRRLEATFRANRSAWGRVFIECGQAARRAAR